MKIGVLFILSLLAGLALPSSGQTNIALAEGFGNDMVLQRSPNTLLRGVGPPGKTLLIQFKIEDKNRFVAPTTNTLVDALGRWSAQVNLTTSEFQRPNTHWGLQIAVEKKKNIADKKQKREYRNILIGDVIIVAGWKDIPRGTNYSDPIVTPAAVRFLDLTQIEALKGTPTDRNIHWETWPRNASEFNKSYSTLTLRLAQKLAEGRCPELSTSGIIGVVLTTPKFALKSIGQDRLETAAVTNLDNSIWTWITEDARKARTDRSMALIKNKRHNIVANIPPIKDYDPAITCCWEGSDPTNQPLSGFTFTSAILEKPPVKP